jgi:hypothetical protein
MKTSCKCYKAQNLGIVLFVAFTSKRHHEHIRVEKNLLIGGGVKNVSPIANTQVFLGKILLKNKK